MVEHHEKIVQHVHEALESADEPLSVGRLQRRIADDGFDVASSALREVCDELENEGVIADVGDSAPKYRLSA